jgi:hypothetical protein
MRRLQTSNTSSFRVGKKSQIIMHRNLEQVVLTCYTYITSNVFLISGVRL